MPPRNCRGGASSLGAATHSGPRRHLPCRGCRIDAPPWRHLFPITASSLHGGPAPPRPREHLLPATIPLTSALGPLPLFTSDVS